MWTDYARRSRWLRLLKWPGEVVRRVSVKRVHAGGISRDGWTGMAGVAFELMLCIDID
jgi:hypothetical protein